MEPAKSGNNSLPVDLIRTLAIILVIMLHASIEPVVVSDFMSPQGVAQWWAVNVYDSLSRVAVPLFVMLGGALLLQPSKASEPLRVFFKKRVNRIALPFIFWGAAYFAWDIFVNHETFSANFILQGILTGPYYHFWFLYLIVGLYLLTPILRIVVTHAGRKLLRYFLLLWVVGTVVGPLLTVLAGFNVSGNIFLLVGWIGYFVLGAYFVNTRTRPPYLLAIVVAAYLGTIIGTYLVVGSIGERVSQFFYDASSITAIAASAGLFLLHVPVPAVKVEGRFPRGSKLLHQVSINTLPIYLFHVMVLETLQKGYLGFRISIETINPVLEIPVITFVTLGICLGTIYVVKKIPYAKRLIG